MQRECAQLISEMDRDLAKVCSFFSSFHLFCPIDSFWFQLRDQGASVKSNLENYSRSFGARSVSDLGSSNQWGVNDSRVLHGIFGGVERDLEELRMLKVNWGQETRKIKGLMLKGLFTFSVFQRGADDFAAATRKEEIERFSKATSDAEVSRMIKSRTLGPEHAESQTQLRRDVRVYLSPHSRSKQDADTLIEHSEPSAEPRGPFDKLQEEAW